MRAGYPEDFIRRLLPFVLIRSISYVQITFLLYLHLARMTSISIPLPVYFQLISIDNCKLSDQNLQYLHRSLLLQVLSLRSGNAGPVSFTRGQTRSRMQRISEIFQTISNRNPVNLLLSSRRGYFLACEQLPHCYSSYE